MAPTFDVEEIPTVLSVMAGLAPVIHVCRPGASIPEDAQAHGVDARHKAGHDGTTR